MKKIIFLLVLVSFSSNCVAQFEYDNYVYFDENLSTCIGTATSNGTNYAFDTKGTKYYFKIATCYDDIIQDNNVSVGWNYGCSEFIKEIDGDSIVLLKTKEQVKNCRFYKRDNYKKSYYVIADTNGIKEYKIKKFRIDNDMNKMVCDEKITVLCPEYVSNELLDEVKDSLKEDGYLFNNFDSIKEIKKALYKFQDQNNLPQGYFDFITLEKLKISKNLYEDFLNE